MEKNLLVSVLLAFCGNVLIAAGQSVQKTQISRFAAKDPARQKFLKGLFWVLGILSSNAGLALIYIAINFGYTTIVGAMNASALVALFLIATFILKEPTNPGEIGGVAMILAGVATMPLKPVAAPPEIAFDLKIVWLSVLAAVVLFAVIIAVVTLKKKRNGLLLAAFAGVMTATSQVFQRISHMESFINSAAGFEQTFYRFVWLPFFLPSFLALQFAYRKNKAITVIPVFNAFTVAASVTAGQVFFGERLSGLQWASVGMILAGVALINIFAIAADKKNPAAVSDRNGGTPV